VFTPRISAGRGINPKDLNAPSGDDLPHESQAAVASKNLDPWDRVPVATGSRQLRPRSEGPRKAGTGRNPLRLEVVCAVRAGQQRRPLERKRLEIGDRPLD